MTSTGGHDSGVDTSNDSSDTMNAAQAVAAAAAAATAAATPSGDGSRDNPDVTEFPTMYEPRRRLSPSAFAPAADGHEDFDDDRALPAPPFGTTGSFGSSGMPFSQPIYIPMRPAADDAPSASVGASLGPMSPPYICRPPPPSPTAASLHQPHQPQAHMLSRSLSLSFDPFASAASIAAGVSGFALAVPMAFISGYHQQQPFGGGQRLSGGKALVTRHSSCISKYPYFRKFSKERRLLVAAALSNVEMVLVLLADGVDPNCSDEHRRSALHLAASRGYTDVVQQLLKFGAKPNQQDSLGNTPLHLAVCSACSKNFNFVVRILLQHGASLKLRDNNGKTPLDLVKTKLKLLRLRHSNDQSPETIKLLLDLSLFTSSLISQSLFETQAANDVDQLEARMQQLSTGEVVSEADALLAKVEQLTLT